MGVVEGMYGGMRQTKMSPLMAIILLVIITLIMMQIGVYLWNKVLVRYVTIAKPVRSLWDILALSILAKIIIF